MIHRLGMDSTSLSRLSTSFTEEAWDDIDFEKLSAGAKRPKSNVKVAKSVGRSVNIAIWKTWFIVVPAFVLAPVPVSVLAVS